MKNWLKKALTALLVSGLPIFVCANTDKDIQKLIDEEAMHYVNALENTQGEALLTLAIELQDSGITDKRVLDTAKDLAISLHESYNADTSRNNEIQTAESLARLIAGSGSSKYSAELLNRFVIESRSRSFRNLSKSLSSRSSWYHGRNQIMNDFSNHNPQHSLRVTRYLNLLDHEDRTYGRYAVKSMTRQKWLDPVVIAHVADIVKDNYKSPGFGKNLDAIAWYIRVLGRDKNDSYKDLLQEIANYAELDKKLKKHVGKALKGK